MTVAMPTDQYISHSSVKKLLAVAQGSYRDPQVENMQRIGSCEVLSPQWDIHITLLFPNLRDLDGRRGRKIVRTRGGGKLFSRQPGQMHAYIHI